MCFNRKFDHIEKKLSSVIDDAKLDFNDNYEVITRKQAAKGMLISGNTISMVGKSTSDCYKKHIDKIMDIITDNFNGQDKKIYTNFGENKLINLVKKCRSNLRNSLEKELHNNLNGPTLGGRNIQDAKRKVEENFIKKLNSIDNSMDYQLSSKLSSIKHTSWRESRGNPPIYNRS